HDQDDGLACRKQPSRQNGNLGRTLPVASKHNDARPAPIQHKIQRRAVEFPAWLPIGRVYCRIVDERSAPALRRDQPVYPVGEGSRRNRFEILIDVGIAPQDRGTSSGRLLAAETAIGLGRLLGGVRVSKTLVARRAGSSREFCRQQVVRQPAWKTV